jgi:mono/diheme cytochrome c family protein
MNNIISPNTPFLDFLTEHGEIIAPRSSGSTAMGNLNRRVSLLTGRTRGLGQAYVSSPCRMSVTNLSSLRNSCMIAGLAVLLTILVIHHAGADARTGELFAQRWCSQCHAIKPNQISPKSQAPTFHALARNPRIDEGWLRTSLRTTPHRGMPKIKLRPEDIDDVISYILSLR